MGLKIYGNAHSRARRVIWCAKELGLQFEQFEMDDAARAAPDFLAINPNGKVPAIQDGELCLFESLAINLYLARRYGQDSLYPRTVEGEGLAMQWLVWSQTELESQMAPILAMIMSRGPSYPDLVEQSTQRIKTALTLLERHLQHRDWFLEDRFTIIDLNMACVVMATALCKIPLDFVPSVQAWLQRVMARPLAPKPRA